MPERIVTAGRADLSDPRLVFLASNIQHLDNASTYHDNLLIAVNEVPGSRLETVSGWVSAGNRVFLDSGVFNLTMTHARKYGVHMNDALALPPDAIEGFDDLLAKYLAMVERLGPGLWGYIEVDQGGRENKIKTRALLEARGLRPVPVYHPINDGWDYFDHLAERYDRICVANLVAAPAADRGKILSTIAARRQEHPGLRWIHALGVNVGPSVVPRAVNSFDASAWTAPLRWNRGAAGEFGYMTKVAMVDSRFVYSRSSADDPDVGYRKSVALLGYQYGILNRNLDALDAERVEAGVEP